MKIIGLMLRDFFKSQFLKIITIIVICMVILWFLFVPSVYLLNEVYPNIPIVNQIIEDTIKIDGTYTELFAESYKSFINIILAIIITVFLIMMVLFPLILLVFVIIILSLITGLFILFVQWVITWKYIPRKVKYYFRDLKRRTGEIND